MNGMFRIHVLKTVSILFFFFTSVELLAQINIFHNPFGDENLYEVDELAITGNECERNPRDPIEADNVSIQFKTYPIFNRQECFVDLWKNSKVINSVIANFEYNFSGESFWRADLGKFDQGDSVQYQIRTNFQNEPRVLSNKYLFTTLGWDYILDVKNIIQEENGVIFECNSTNPKLKSFVEFIFTSDNNIKIDISFNVSPNVSQVDSRNYKLNITEKKAVISIKNLQLEVNLKPFSYKLISLITGKEITKEFQFADHSSIGILNDGENIFKVSESFYTPYDEKFYGFGERYNALNQRGNEIDNYTANIWTEQDKKTYTPVPFYFTNKGYGIFLKTYYYVKFDLDSKNKNKCSIISNFGRKKSGSLEYYFFISEDPNEIISSYTKFTGKPEEIPVWTLGPWISANEWDKQIEIEDQLDSLIKYDIPNTVVVLEAWSDEETFYIFNDAKYKIKQEGKSYLLKDFEFSGRWPDPFGMINNLHENNMRIILWNIPVLKSSSVINEQREADEQFAIKNNFVVRNPDGSPNRIPTASWFSRSLNLDFTNKNASDWWFANRRYLVEEMDIDGFKCDGGEFIWGRGLTFSDGRKGDEMRNCYPEIYVDGYYNFVKSVKNDAVVFHRAGTFGAQKHPLVWNGDQKSTFKAFKEAIRSCINFSISGIPFVAFDFAGYTEEEGLTSELYKRSLAMAAFSPVMQFHSAYSGDANLERSPWAVASRLNAPSCISVYKKYANIRFNIIPYLYTETRFTSNAAVPIMKPMFVEYPNDSLCVLNEFDYLLGRSLLVCPVIEPEIDSVKIYLPEGSWYDFWDYKLYKGKQHYKIEVTTDYLPLFIKSGSVIPLNLDSHYQLAQNMTNDLSRYNNLTFFVFPKGSIKYKYYDYTDNSEKEIVVLSDEDNISVQIPKFETDISIVIKTPFVGFDNKTKIKLNSVKNLNDFMSFSDSYYYNSETQLLYIKLNNMNENNQLSILIN
jgi:alpha-glucosidase (family GH31 glycosyl hydrolase)